MSDNILLPKYKKGKKPVRVRKPSRPLDGINHRIVAKVVTPAEDDAPPTRIELIAKASELGVKYSKRTSDEKLLELIDTVLKRK
jgi:hypothetical protein